MRLLWGITIAAGVALLALNVAWALNFECVRWESVLVTRYEQWGNTLEPHAEMQDVCMEWREVEP